MTNIKKKSYENILKAVEENLENLTDTCYTQALCHGLHNRIKIQEVCEIFNIYDLPETCQPNYIEIDKERLIIYANRNNSIVAWSDDGRQPCEEYVYRVGFPTGAYIFGDLSWEYDNFYPKEIFNEFFEKLKTYNPKYSDTNNHCLYFSPDNAYLIHRDYRTILQRYSEKVQLSFKSLRAEKLKKELRELENDTR